MYENEGVGLTQMLIKSYRDMILTNQGFHLKGKQAQRRAAGDRFGRKYSEKYVFMSKNMTFGPLGHILTL